MTTVEELLDWAEQEIKGSKAVDLWRQRDARVNAEELLSDVVGKEITADDFDVEMADSSRRRFRRLVARRAAGEPVALILGKTEFRGMMLRTRHDVFVPRNSSEFLAEKAIRRLRGRRRPVAVDVATGIGPVALAVAREVPRARVYGVDIWPPSIRVARENAGRLQIRNVRFLRSDMLSALPKALRGDVDVFTIHPPYVARRYLRTLSHEVRGYEPEVSLTDGSSDGLGLVRRLAADAPGWLRPGGWLLVEVSPDLSRSAKSVLSAAGAVEVRSERDSLGATRVISGRFPPFRGRSRTR